MSMARKKADPVQTGTPEPVIEYSKYINRDKELRTQRMNLIIQPSLYEQVKKRASAERISVNELVIRAMAQYLAGGEQ